MLKEFKEFAVKGNVMDMAVGIIIGVAFTKVVDSLVKDVLMPPIGMVLGNVDFSNLFINLNLKGESYSSLKQAQEAAAPTINYGLFLNAIIQFLIVAFAVFLIIRQINRLRRPAAAAAPTPATTKECPRCCSSIPVKANRCPNCTSDLVAA